MLPRVLPRNAIASNVENRARNESHNPSQGLDPDRGLALWMCLEVLLPRQVQGTTYLNETIPTIPDSVRRSEDLSMLCLLDGLLLKIKARLITTLRQVRQHGRGQLCRLLSRHPRPNHQTPTRLFRTS